MPDIRLRNQPFDLTFHPSQPIVYSSLLTGEVKAFQYDEQSGEASSSWSLRPTKRAARCIATSPDCLWMGGKAGDLFQITFDGLIQRELPAHDSPVNRIHCMNPNLLATGDDDGVIKFWDPRQSEAVRVHTHHFDYISDFTHHDNQIIATSGDGRLSVLDVRAKSPISVSDDQEDELLSIVSIKDQSKAVVGTTLGVLTIWHKAKGWRDCVDRIPGHPASIDAIVALSPDVVATGSEDGLIRVVQIQPNKFLGAIASHDYPIERMQLNGRWLGSVSHDECIKLTDVGDLFEESDGEDEVEGGFFDQL